MLSHQIPNNRQQLLDFQQLQLTMRGIRVLNKVPSSIVFISQLYLDGNHLVSLSGIQQFLNLQVLHFDYNYISLVGELKKIKNAFFMKELSFICNPIEKEPNLNLEKLREGSFSRLVVLNPPHLLSNKSHFDRQKQVIDEFSYINNEMTERRAPQYFNDQVTTSRKRQVGKICSNFKEKTMRTQKTREHTLSRDTRESTFRPDSITHFPPILRKIQRITPFQFPHNYLDRKHHEENELENQSATARFEDSQKAEDISEQFLNEQKYLLATLFHRRSLLEKTIQGFKIFQARFLDIEDHESEIIDDSLETIQYSLIKLKHEAARNRK